MARFRLFGAVRCVGADGTGGSPWGLAFSGTILGGPSETVARTAGAGTIRLPTRQLGSSNGRNMRPTLFAKPSLFTVRSPKSGEKSGPKSTILFRFRQRNERNGCNEMVNPKSTSFSNPGACRMLIGVPRRQKTPFVSKEFRT